MEYAISRGDARYTKKFKIYDYILNHNRPTEYMVAKYAHDEGICSRATTHSIIIELIDEGKVIDRKEKNGFHRLCINDKSDYQTLINRIDDLSKGVAELTGIINYPSFKKVTLQRLKSSTSFPPKAINYSEIMHVCQLKVYRTIDTIFREIMNLTSENDRQTLYTRLINELYRAKSFSLIIRCDCRG